MSAFLLAMLLLAQAQPPASPPPCSAPEHRQFDFWVGEWVVSGPKGQQAGINRIEKVENGCAIQENWTSARGPTGRSLNIYDPASKRWIQVWAGADGSLLLLQGAYDGGKMVMEGTSIGQSGTEVRDRITWSPLPGSRVRHLWEQSSDGGKTWSVIFDGTYSRAR
jgi:hypothetical protein